MKKEFNIGDRISLMELKKLLMELELNNFTREQQDRICELCEIHILNCNHSTSTFLCEGSMCDVAIEYLKDEYNEQLLVDNEEKEKYKYLLIKK